MPPVRITRVTRACAAALMQLCDRHMAESPAGANAQRAAGGRVLELMEALFEAPLRAWAWICERDGVPQGYAFGTVGFSMVERAYYFNLESLFVSAEARPSGAASALFDAARAMADELGCIDLRWQVPVAQAGALALPGHAAAASVIQYVFPTSVRSLRDE
ncbi:MAG: hypothetical protein A2213_03130 [Lysobacterales bacterium RIFOXYA1_FULL_68_6]|jgi:GNAT superfamily N-acetyltransferase|nr:MAG: hypothetical protein A2213_03130 [Xanthomonadales bacterium RIFOXYA1_FULL_68_6]